MSSKRDVFLIRLAVRWRWLSAVEGEDCLFLKRRFGDKLTIEEIIRRRGYLEESAIQNLKKAVDEQLGHPSGQPSSSASSSSPPLSGQPLSDSPLSDPPSSRGLPQSTASVSGSVLGSEEVRRREPSVLAPILERIESELKSARTVYQMSPYAAREEAEEKRSSGVEVDFFDEDEEQGATIIASIPEIFRAARPETKDLIQRRPPRPEPPQPPSTGPSTRPSTAHESTGPEDPSLEPEYATNFADESDTMIAWAPRYSTSQKLHVPLVIPRDSIPSEGGSSGESSGRGSRRSGISDIDEDSMPGDALAELILNRPSQVDEADQTPDPLDRPPPFARPVSGRTIAYDPSTFALAPVELGEFGGYRLERVLERGRFSDAFLARRKNGPDRTIVLHVLNLDPISAARHIHKQGEALLAAARIASPHVVHILDVGKLDGRYFVAVEYVDGVPLDRLREEEDVSPQRALVLARELASALVAIHAVGVLHGDIRPENIWVDREGKAILGGIAGISTRGGEAPSPTRAPEQLLGARIDARADLYALGASLFHLLTGSPLANVEEEGELLARALEEDGPDPRAQMSGIPSAIREIVATLLARDPAGRFVDAAALVDALDQVIFDLEVEAVPEELPAPPKPVPTLLRALLIGSGVALACLGLLFALPTTGLLNWSVWAGAYWGALLGGAGAIVATMLLAVLGLIRRGEIPLPASTAWLVTMRDGLGIAAALSLLAGFVLSPPSALNVAVSTLGLMALLSWIYGLILRHRIARARPDRGVGRVLAVLGDPMLLDWGRVHVPMQATLTSLSFLRWAFLAYFSPR